MKIRTGIEKLGKGMILLIFSIFTIFPFVWMIFKCTENKGGDYGCPFIFSGRIPVA